MTKLRKGFTLIELLVVISIVSLLIGILLPALSSARMTARQLSNSAQLRGIHQGMVVFAQSNQRGGGDGRYPGLNPKGFLGGLSPVPAAQIGASADVPVPIPFVPGDAASPPSDDASWGDYVFARLLTEDYFPAEYAVAPGDGEVIPFEPDPSRPYAASDTVSYALTSLKHGGYWLQEWAATGNSQALILSDRFIHVQGEPNDDYHSIWTDPDSGAWKGTFTFNDNSTHFSTNAERKRLRYGNGPTYDATLDAGALDGWGVFFATNPTLSAGSGAMTKDIDGR